MDLGPDRFFEPIVESLGTNSSKHSAAYHQFTYHDSQTRQKWETNSNLNPNSTFQYNFPEFEPPLEPSPQAGNPKVEIERLQQFDRETKTLSNACLQGWDLRVMLSNLSFLEQKIHELQSIVQSFVREGALIDRSNEQSADQQLVAADLSSIVSELVSTAGTLLSSSGITTSAADLFAGHLGSMLASGPVSGKNSGLQQNENSSAGSWNQKKKIRACGAEQYSSSVEGSESLPAGDQNEVKEFEVDTGGRCFSLGSYEVLQLEEEEILAHHSHFCSICGKGFKRDANLRMHMRGHGDMYKTPAALAKPISEESSSQPMPAKRYSCPYQGCKRNKNHKNFQPLKTILCVKNHYKRSHCDKSYTCSRCNCKRFSVIADLKTHEKHCGRGKWLCSCGTTFSRKDKLFGHVALFQGHTPVLPADEIKETATSEQRGQRSSAFRMDDDKGFEPNSTAVSGVLHSLNFKVGDSGDYFSEGNFDWGNFGEIHDYSQSGFGNWNPW